MTEFGAGGDEKKIEHQRDCTLGYIVEAGETTAVAHIYNPSTRQLEERIIAAEMFDHDEYLVLGLPGQTFCIETIHFADDSKPYEHFFMLPSCVLEEGVDFCKLARRYTRSDPEDDMML